MLRDIEVNIRRSRRKTLSIYVERDGTVSILAPQIITDEKIEDVIRKKEYTIYKHHAKWQELNSVKVKREFVSGQSFLYQGRNYRLQIVDSAETALLLKNGFFQIRRADLQNARQFFISFYKEKGQDLLAERVGKYKNRMGAKSVQIKIMELKNRWASCSSNGNLNFHWKTIMAPLSVLDYIIVHELAHLSHKKHSQAFWNEVDKVLPDYQKRINWLCDNGARMTL